MSLLIQRFKIKKTKITGSSAQFQEFEGNLSKADSWEKVLDCDFLISTELGEWPTTAIAWTSLTRNWPTAEVIQLYFYVFDTILKRL